MGIARKLLGLATATLVTAGLLSAGVGASGVAGVPTRLCADLAQQHFTVENMGDSIAAGYNVTESRRWYNQLWDQLPPGSAVWNGAVSGSFVGDYLPGGAYYYHTQFTKAVQPTLLVMNWRVNDQWMSIGHSAEGYTPAVFKQRYRQLLTEVRAATPTTTLAIAVSPWLLDTRIDQGQYKQQDYVNALWDLKLEFDTVWIDWTRFFAKAGQSNSAGLLSYDLTHPSEAGQSVMAAQVWEWLRGYCA